ncbi:MAG: alkaline phosphatase family protein [Sphingomonas sp.]|uniref:alkaline phosphatase family protein n=1 Tax=Sphingomonas sp. TaxID=28214 RepID=UPI0017E66E93|nr:alkaline phosphatase family protein [Sphingomonas sp.]MBA3666309.1 alkaline phosphatase family protein [Sphingomonas sp.]
MRRILFLAGLTAATACSSAPAQPARLLAPTAPKLIVALSIDQFSSDLFEEYRPVLLGGIGRLSRGAAFRNGYQGHSATETCPGHSTIMTGSRPSRTGIIANVWYDLSQSRSDKAVYCAEDERIAGSSSLAYTVSPYHLRVPTLGDRLKAVQPVSRNVAVAGKDRAAVMMSGRAVDQRWYWDGKTFATDLKGAGMPRAVTAARTAVAQAIAQDRSALQMPALCQQKSRVVSLEGGGAPVGNGAFARKAGDARNFRASPEFDGATLALAAALIEEMQLGRGRSTDIISVGLSATDFVGHSYGTEGAEMCLQLFSLDRDLGDFFRLLDSKGIDYLVTLTADHGGQDVPERKREQGVPGAARVPASLFASAMGKAIGARLGLKGPVLYGDGAFGDMYVDRALPDVDRTRALAAAVGAYKAHPMVEAVFTHDQLRATKSPTASPDKWSLVERARASFDDQRSGDLIVLLKRDITPIADTKSYVATHGSPWDYDRRVPVLFWRREMEASDRTDAVETADIMPTLAAALGLAVDPRSIDGKCLGAIPGIACPVR